MGILYILLEFCVFCLLNKNNIGALFIMHLNNGFVYGVIFQADTKLFYVYSVDDFNLTQKYQISKFENQYK